MIATPDPSLPAELRRLLLLSDGHRNIGTLAGMLPEHDLVANLDRIRAASMLQGLR